MNVGKYKKVFKGENYIEIAMPGVNENEKAFSWIRINGVSKAVRRIEITERYIGLVSGLLGGFDSSILVEDVMRFEIEAINK